MCTPASTTNRIWLIEVLCAVRSAWLDLSWGIINIKWPNGKTNIPIPLRGTPRKRPPPPALPPTVWQGSKRVKNTLVFGTFIALLSPAILLEEGLGVGAVFALAVTLLILCYGGVRARPAVRPFDFAQGHIVPFGIKC